MDSFNSRQSKIDLFSQINSEYFLPEDLKYIIYKIKTLDDNQLYIIQSLKFQEVKTYFRLSVLDIFSEKTRNPRKYNFELIMRQITQFDNENRKHRIEIDLKLKSIVENLRIAATMKMLNESYFIEDEWEIDKKDPYTIEQINDLMNKGDLTLNSNIKYSYDSTNFKPVLLFEEFNQKFKDFL